MSIREITTGGFVFGARFVPTRGYLPGPTIYGPWVHPVHTKSENSVRIDGNNQTITAIASQPRIELDGDTDIDPPADNERIEVEG